MVGGVVCELRYRHLLVSDFSDATATLPPEEIQQFFPAGGNGNAAQDPMEQAAAQGRQLEDQNALMVLKYNKFLNSNF